MWQHNHTALIQILDSALRRARGWAALSIADACGKTVIAVTMTLKPNRLPGGSLLGGYA